MGNDKKATIYSVFIIADITIYCGFNGMLGLKIPRDNTRAGSSPATSTIETGEIHKISPVLLCLGSNWEVILPRFQSKADGFVCNLQFIVYFVNFLQDILL